MKFKCNHTGLLYEYLTDYDIKEMLRHPEYTAIAEEEILEETPVKPKKNKGE